MQIKSNGMRAAISIMLIFSLTSFLGMSSATAVTYGKTALQQRNYLVDDSPLIHSVGILKKNASGRLGIASSFIPYYYMGVNKGLPRIIDATLFAGNLAYKVLDPNGKEVVFTKNYQEVVGSGTITEDANSRAVQTDPTYGKVVTFLPTVIGTYSVYVWHDFNENGIQDIDETYVKDTFIFVEKPNVSMTLTNYGKIAGNFTANSIGILTKICLLNGTAVTNLEPSYDYDGQTNPKPMEQISLTTNSTTEIIDAVSKWSNGTFSMSDDPNSTSYVLTNENFNSSGCAYINHFNTAAAPGKVTLSFVGAGNSIAGLSGTISSDFINATTYPISSGRQREVAHANSTNGSYSSTSSVIAPVSGDTPTAMNVYTPLGTSALVSIATTTDPGVANVSGGTVLMRVVDTDGKYTGLKNASFMVALASAVNATNLTQTYTFAATLGENDSYKIYVQGTDSLLNANLTGSVEITVRSQSRVPKVVEGKLLKVRQIKGTKATHYLLLKDQFGTLLANTEITTVLTGRNSSTNGYRTYKSSANGIIEFISEDKNTESDLSIDVVSGLDSNGTKLLGKGLIIDYGVFTPASNIKITGAATNEITPNTIFNYIDLSANGASNTTVKMTAILTDSYGFRVPAGIPVTWSIAGLDGKASIYSDATIGEDWNHTYTDENGEAFTYIYSTAIGDVNVFASSDTLTATNNGVIHFANQTTDVRIISSQKGDSYFKIHAEDRYGNPVKGVELSVQRVSGPGRVPYRSYYPFTIFTDKNGDATFEVTGGKASFTVTTETLKYGQTGSDADYVGAAAISSTSVGANLASKGVDTVSIEIDSKDYVLESSNASKSATLAVDKATEISNLAAEKADNAFLATQDTILKLQELTSLLESQFSVLTNQIVTLTKTINKIKSKIK